jgi:quercetin dioxygenase-like cupin family protein
MLEVGHRSLPRVRESYKRPFIGSISAIAAVSGLGEATIQILLPACAPIHREVSMSTFKSFSTVRPYKIWAGAVARAVHGERVTMALIDLDPNLEIPEHHHVNEQLGFVVLGTVTMVIDGEEKELAAGEAYSIKSDVPHSARTGREGATVIDVFAPVRSDWEKAERLEPSRGHWPR